MNVIKKERKGEKEPKARSEGKGTDDQTDGWGDEKEGKKRHDVYVSRDCRGGDRQSEDERSLPISDHAIH